MIEMKIEGDLAILNFENPEANSFTLAEAVALDKIVKVLSKEGLPKKGLSGKGLSKNEALDSKVRAVLFLSGSGKYFCTGGNLSNYSKMTKARALETNRKISRSLDGFTKLAIPKAALVSGDCFGGGVELLSCFDTVIATPRAVFGFWQRRVGLIFGWGGGARWSAKIGTAKLVKLSLAAKTLSVYQAKDFGIVDKIVPQPLLRSAGDKWARDMSAWPQIPVRSLLGWSPGAERPLFEQLWHNPEHKEALNSFSKRK